MTVARFVGLTCSVLVFLSADSALLARAPQALQRLDVRILDAQDAPVPGARVTIVDRAGGPSRTAVSDTTGVAHFEDLPPGAYLVEAQAGRIAAMVTAVSIEAGQRRELSMALGVHRVSDLVVVTAAGTAQSLDAVSKAASAVTLGEMDGRNDRTLADAVRRVPGVRIQQLGGPGESTAIHIRGMRAEDTAVLIDGVRFRDAGATQGDASAFVSDLLVTNPDRIEVLRGSGASLYGSHALGGVLNVMTRSGAGSPSGRLFVEAGALGTRQMRGRVGGGLLSDRLSYSLGVTRLTIGDGLDGDDEADNTSAQGALGVMLADGTVRVSARFFGADAAAMVNEGPSALGGLPASGVVAARPLADSELKRYEAGVPIDALNVGGATFIPSANDADNRRTSRFRSTLLQLSHQASPRLGYRVFHHGVHTRRRFDEGPLGVSGFEPAELTSAVFEGHVDTLGARADLQIGSRQLLTFGYEFERETYSSAASATPTVAPSTVDVTEQSHTAFVQDQMSLTETLQVSAAVRAQHFTLAAPRLTPAESPPFQGVTFSAPPAAITADVSAVYGGWGPDTSVRVHAGTGYRAPSLFERFGTSFGQRGYSIFGDPRLAPEHAVTVDAGIDRHLQARRVRVSATIFSVWLQDTIVFDFSGGIDAATDPFGRSSGYRTVGGASSRGLELQVAALPSAETRLEGSYTFTAADPRTSGPPELNQAAAIPRHHVSVTLSHQFTRRLFVSADLIATSSHLGTLADPVTFTPRVFRFTGTTRANVAAVWRVPLSDRPQLRFFGRVDGLVGHARYESGFRTPGRSATAGVGVEF